MAQPPEENEVRIVIRSAGMPTGAADPHLVPADVFKKTFNSFLEALKAAEKQQRGGDPRTPDSVVFISDLRMGSNEFALTSRPQAVELLKYSMVAVRHPEVERMAEHPEMAWRVVNLGKAFNPSYSIVAKFKNAEAPIDSLFQETTSRLEFVLKQNAEKKKIKPFVGSALITLDGKIEAFDYSGDVWVGRFRLSGSDKYIKCVFDRSKGEDEFNPYGNKRVSLVGTAIYSGDGSLPEQISVISLTEIPESTDFVDIRGTMNNLEYQSWDPDAENIH